MLVIRAGIHKMHARIANREDPDQTASSVIKIYKPRVVYIIKNICN